MGWFGPVGDCGCVQDCDEPCADVACLDSEDGASSTSDTRLSVTISGLNSVDTYQKLSPFGIGGSEVFIAEFTGLDYLHGTYLANKRASPDCDFVATGNYTISVPVDIYELLGVDTDGCPTPITLYENYTATRAVWSISYNPAITQLVIDFSLQRFDGLDFVNLVGFSFVDAFTECEGSSITLNRTGFYEKSPGVPCPGSSSNLGGTSNYDFLP